MEDLELGVKGQIRPFKDLLPIFSHPQLLGPARIMQMTEGPYSMQTQFELEAGVASPYGQYQKS